MRRLVSLALDQRTAIWLAALLLLAAGAYVGAGLRQEEMPDIDIPYVIVTTAYPGATPEDVSRDVTRPMEEALRDVPGLKNLYSTSAANISAITMEFDLATTNEDNERNVRQALAPVSLPDGAGEPNVTTIGFADAPVLQVSLLAGEGMTREALGAVVRERVLPGLTSVAGVGRVDAQGLDEPSLRIVLDPEALRQSGLTQAAVVQYLKAANLALPAGTTRAPDGSDLNVRVEGAFASLDDIRNLRIPVGAGLSGGGLPGNGGLAGGGALPGTDASGGQGQPSGGGSASGGGPGGSGGSPGAAGAAGGAARPGLPQSPSGTPPTVRLGDIAEVTLGTPAPTSYTRYNGQPSVRLDVVKEPDASSADVAEAALAKVRDLGREEGFDVRVVYDSADTIRDSVAGMEREVGLGALFAALVIFLFLRRGRATLVAALAIPVSLAIAVLALAREGVTLNVMTLGGMAVAAGRVVDDAIVVTENVFRRARGEGYSRRTIVEGAAEVGSAITASTVTTVAVFAPLGLVGGIVGRVFQPFALTVVFALVASLLVAVTLVPALTYLLHRREEARADGEASAAGAGDAAERPWGGTSRRTRRQAPPGLAPWQARYRRLLNWLLNHRAFTAACAIGLFAWSATLAGQLGTSFLPADQIDTVTVDAVFPTGTPLDEMDERARAAEAALLARDDVASVQTSVGSTEGLPTTGGRPARNHVTMMVGAGDGVDAGALAQELQERLEPLLAPARVSANAFSPITGTNSVMLVFSGSDEEELGATARRVEERIASLPGLANITDTLRETATSVEIDVDAERAAARGLSTAQVLAAVHEALAEEGAGTAEIAGRSYEISVRTGDAPDLDALRAMPLPAPFGAPVRVEDVAGVQLVRAPTAINRRNLEPYVAIQADVTAQDVGAVTAAVAAAVDEVKLPPGVTARDVGVTQTIQEGFTQMAEAIAVAIAIVYLVMLVTFGEAIAPLAILFSLPFAGVGSIAALHFTGYALSIPALIGVLMLIGIVVTNAIVLMDRFQRQRRLGLTVREALLEAAVTRLRPILMTALATMFALLPLALGLGEGSLISATLAWVVVGGLVTSTALTLVVVPLAYEALYGIATWPARRRERRRERRSERRSERRRGRRAARAET